MKLEIFAFKRLLQRVYFVLRIWVAIKRTFFLEQVVVYVVNSLESVRLKKQLVLFVLKNRIFHPKHSTGFFHENDNQQSFSSRNSAVIGKLAYETGIDYAEIDWTGIFLNRFINLIFHKTTCGFSSINVLLEHCHIVRTR